MNTKIPKVCCICPTRGRFSSLMESVSFFISQDYSSKEMIIFNNHPTPIIPHPKLAKFNIKVVNAGDKSGYSINRIYHECLQHVSDDSELISIWDDDDVYFPWFLSDNIKKLLNSSKKIIRSKFGYWQDDSLPQISLVSNTLEASMIGYRENIFFNNEQYDKLDEKNFRHPHLTWVEAASKKDEFLYNDEVTAMFRWNYGREYQHLQSSGPHKNVKDDGNGLILKPAKISHIFEKIVFNIRQTLKDGYVKSITNSEKASLLTKFLDSGIEQFNHIDKYKVWVYWQSNNKMPVFLSKCLKTIETNTFCDVVLVNQEYIDKHKFNLPEFYSKFAENNKADYMRIFLLKNFGGFYLDIDTIVHGDLDKFYFQHITFHDTVFPWENGVKNAVISAILGSQKNSKIFNSSLENINKYMNNKGQVTWSELNIVGVHNSVKQPASNLSNDYHIFGIKNHSNLNYTNDKFKEWKFQNINKDLDMIVLHGSTLGKLYQYSENDLKDLNLNLFLDKCINEPYDLL